MSRYNLEHYYEVAENTKEDTLLPFYKEEIMERIKQVSQEAYEWGYDDGWDEFECCHGYGVFDGEYPTKFGMIEGQHIERIDIMEVWSSDIKAAQHAEKHEGIKIIRDIPNLYKVFIDTPENREKIIKQIKEAK